MTHRELCRILAQRRSLTLATTAQAVDAVIDAIVAALARRERVELRGFGAFYARSLSARQSPHPQSGAPRMIAARRTPAFRVSPAWRARLGAIRRGSPALQRTTETDD